MEVKYEQRIVAFVDVLGFSNLVYSKTTDLISKYFTFVVEDFQNAVAKHGFQFLIISDSIVLSTPDTKENLKTIVVILYRLQQKLLEEEGILIRGGISHGELHLDRDSNIIVGQGLINAYKLESDASYPRVILDRSFIPKYYTGTADLVTDLHWVRHEPLSPYPADFVFLDYGKGIGFSIQKRKFDQIIKTLREHYYKNEHIEKYEWLKVYLNDSVSTALTFLENKATKSKQDHKRIKLLGEFLADITAL